ncbi:MAG: hypothetical protein TV41_04395 [Wolbachia endosymbiont of Dactylopius coccus]|nr:MAG: hypothetical protein TV41_04395 [Wolbachia endosymbiont of Dactylopius coccus]
MLLQSGEEKHIKLKSTRAIERWIEENPNITIKEAKIRILEEFGLNMGKSTVHREMQKMKFSYITPRPVHYKQDKESQEEFKKKSQ